MGKLEEYKRKYIDRFYNQDTQNYIDSRRRIDFIAGIIALMIGNIAAVCVFVSSSKDLFLAFSVVSMLILFADALWAYRKKKVKQYHYLLAFILTCIYGLVMFFYCESGMITFCLAYPVLSIFILKQLWGNLLIATILITGLVAENHFNPADMWSNFNLVYISVYLMFWAFSITIETARTYMERRIIQQKEELEFYANYDSLTRLYNRRHFYEAIKERYSEDVVGCKVSLIILDIDNFKSINDNYGHNVGDEILVELANRLRLGCREQDLVCRWGGEEFLILAASSRAQRGKEYAQRLCNIVSEKDFNLENGGKLAVTASFGGIFTDSFKVDDIVKLVHAADENLYYSKNNGKNMVCFSIYS